MHIEEDIYALESEMEYVADVEKLEKLYEEKTKKELLRADLYNELENMVEYRRKPLPFSFAGGSGFFIMIFCFKG